MTNLNLLGAEHSSTDGTKFVGIEHLYDLGMIYRGCRNDCLSVIYTPGSEKSFEDIVNAVTIMLLSSGTLGSKVQVLYDPEEIELAYIALSLRAKRRDQESNNIKFAPDQNTEIEPDVVYDINNADKVTLLVAMTSASENVINKLITQANEGDVPIYIVTNNRDISTSFLEVDNEAEVEDAEDDDEATYPVPDEVKEALTTKNFDNLTKAQALACPQLFKSYFHEGKEYILLSVTGKPDETVYFEILPNNKLSLMKNGL